MYGEQGGMHLSLQTSPFPQQNNDSFFSKSKNPYWRMVQVKASNGCYHELDTSGNKKKRPKF